MNPTELSQSYNKVDENDPKQLKIIVQDLIQKSKILINNLEETLNKLQKIQMQKDFWKYNYYSFKESCQKYIQSKGIDPFQYITALQHKLKKLSMENQFLNQSFRMGNYKTNKSIIKTNESTSVRKRPQPIKKSISTISFAKQTPNNNQCKKIQLFKLSNSKGSASSH